jgi:hypothetical protein
VAKTWVLHTETKGTGAQMVPLESVQKRASTTEPVFVRRPDAAAPEPAAESLPRAPRRFRIVDVMTRQVLADDVGAREAVDALRDVHSVVDVNIYVWQDEPPRWRLLTLGDQRTLLAVAHSPERESTSRTMTVAAAGEARTKPKNGPKSRVAAKPVI